MKIIHLYGENDSLFIYRIRDIIIIKEGEINKVMNTNGYTTINLSQKEVRIMKQQDYLDTIINSINESLRREDEKKVKMVYARDISQTAEQIAILAGSRYLKPYELAPIVDILHKVEDRLTNRVNTHKELEEAEMHEWERTHFKTPDDEDLLPFDDFDDMEREYNEKTNHGCF